MRIKSGIGYDIHRLEEGRKLFLGGIDVPFSKGLVGHSDGDCLIHAIIDALLGALGQKDIGQLFPDTDPGYAGVRSVELLRRTTKEIDNAGAEISNIDVLVVAEEPKLGRYIPDMKNLLCPILGLAQEDLGIKAKTNEGLGDVGEGRAIAAWAVALLRLP